jgi:hypothetical protein
MKKQTLFLLIFVAGALLLSSCLAHPVDVSSVVTQKPAGFWMGLWHGIIAPISFIVSLFNDSVAMYAVNNNGGWYDFGFLLGAGVLLGGGRKASKFHCRHRDDE